MWFIPSLRAITPGRRPRQRPGTSRPATVLTLEPLEDRCLLSFGSGGIVTTLLGSGSWAGAGLILPNGDLVAGGNAQTKSGGTLSAGFALAEYTPTGALNTAFGSGGSVVTQFNSRDDGIGAVAVQADGKLVAVGGVDDTKSPWGPFNIDIGLVRYNANGTLDTTFGSKGKVTTDLSGINDGLYGPGGLVIQPDGKILVAGYANNEGSLALVRYNANGSLDVSFGSGGKVLEPVGPAGFSGLALQPDGKIVAGGRIGGNDGSSFAVARYLPNGSPDPSFGSNGKVTQPWNLVDGLVLQPDGKIVTVSDGLRLTRLDASGNLDPTFGGGSGTVIHDLFADSITDSRSLALQSDGKIVVAGRQYAGSVPGPAFSRILVVRCNADGSLDNTFGAGGVVSTVINDNERAEQVRIQGDGKIVVFGGTTGGVSQFVVVRYNPDGSLDAAAPLLAAGGPVSDHPSTQMLTQAGLQPLVEEAVARWQALGLSAAQVETLQHADIRIANLGGTTLGLESGNSILIDDNAAGWGWFVDPTPRDDSEFTTPGDQGEQKHMDLLTVLMHEMGHVLGLDHEATGVMQETLDPGTRLSPLRVDLHFAGLEDMADVALALSMGQR